MILHTLERSDEEKKSTSVGTAALLEYLQAKHPNTTFSFALGADAYRDLVAGKWKESNRVLQLLQGRLVVFHRDDGMSQTPHEGDLARWITVDSLGSVSSSKVRTCRSRTELESLVVSAVLEYIVDKRLYGFAEEGAMPS